VKLIGNLIADFMGGNERESGDGLGDPFLHFHLIEKALKVLTISKAFIVKLYYKMQK
jgi:hypothetical protein